MCRFLGMDGSYGADFQSIFRSIQDVAEYDKLFYNIYGKEMDPNHPDGWGYVNFNGQLIDFKKFANPIYKSNQPSVENGKIIIHARKASKGQPLGALNAHPFHRSLKNSEIFMVHNGGVKKELLGVRVIEAETHTDTETFLYYIRDRGDIVKSLKEALMAVEHKNLMSGSLNLAILNIDRDGRSRMFAYSDYSKESDFIKLFFVKNDKWGGVFSSSIIQSKFFPPFDSKELLRTRVLYEFNSEGIQESK